MKQIRSGVFETNSSSMHSIAISKEPVIGFPESIYFYLGEYGWEFSDISPASYLYTAIMTIYDKKDRDNKLNKLKSILDSRGIKYEFETPRFDSDGWLDNGYIDHSDELGTFIETVLSDEDMLMRLLFSNSCVFTGNDNSTAEEQAYVRRWEKDYAEDNWYTGMFTMKENPYYMGNTNYDWFYKGN